jgi:hypothetical protein
MIIVKLMGGLGNQMFQYAAGRRLSNFRGTELKLDLSWFESISAVDTRRQYELGAFTIQEQFASSEETGRFREGLLLRKFGFLFPFRERRHIHEKHYQFDPDILRLPDNVYLDGYWQSPKYFSDIQDMIQTEFAVRTGPDDVNRRMADEIAGAEAVAVHVRRGDYVSNPATSNYHGTCSMEYYQIAVKAILGRVKQPHFFVFSDDPAWARENFPLAGLKTVIDQNGADRAFEDMRLMSLCKYHIIANSSFSWWGAWLSKNPEKIVIAPKQWFNDPKIVTGDLIPETWIRLESQR